MPEATVPRSAEISESLLRSLSRTGNFSIL
jgi:hypothetical protein